jgi:hypothetical protein
MAIITGGQTLICSGSVIFGATAFPVNGQWAVSPNLILSNISTTSATVTANGQGTAWIQILNSNGSLNAMSSLWLGTPTVVINGPTNPPQIAHYYANVPAEADVWPSNYQWILSPQLNNNLYGVNTNHLTIEFYIAMSYKLECRATNSCGTGDYSTMYI